MQRYPKFEQVFKSSEQASFEFEPIFDLAPDGKTMKVGGTLDSDFRSSVVYSENDVRSYLNSKLNAKGFTIQKIEMYKSRFIATVELVKPVTPLEPIAINDGKNPFKK